MLKQTIIFAAIAGLAFTLGPAAQADTLYYEDFEIGATAETHMGVSDAGWASYNDRGIDQSSVYVWYGGYAQVRYNTDLSGDGILEIKSSSGPATKTFTYTTELIPVSVAATDLELSVLVRDEWNTIPFRFGIEVDGEWYLHDVTTRGPTYQTAPEVRTVVLATAGWLPWEDPTDGFEYPASDGGGVAFSTLSGNLTGVGLLTIPPYGRTGHWDDVTLTGTPTSLPGDTDDNGVVDGADYIALKANIGQETGATTADGDFDADGDVDWHDLQTLRAHFGETSGSPMVPEPASAMLLMFGAAALLRRRRAILDRIRR